MQLTLKAPYRKVHEAKEAKIAIEHAHLNFKTTESLLALMLSEAKRRGPNIVFICAEPEKFQWTIESWFPKIRKKTIRKIIRYELPKYGLTFWLSPEHKLIPVEYSCIVVTDAHLIGRSPIPGATSCSLIIAGAIADQGHWFYTYCNNEDVKRLQFDHKEVVKAFPDQQQYVLEEKSPEFARLMELKDTKISLANFGSFSKRRLKVRTDKGREYLSENQQKEAFTQLGEGWHTGKSGSPVVTFELSYLQKRYRAMKRWWAMRHINKCLLLKYRRGGFTTLEQGESYALCASTQRTQVATLAHKDASTKRIFKIAKLFHEFDPKAPKLVQENQSAIEFANGSYFFIGTAGGKGGFRGDTLQRVHGSETAFWCEGPNKDKRVEEVVASILGAASRGEIVLETTPNGIEWFAKTYKEAKQGLNDWGHIFLPWFYDPANILPNGTFTPEEILDTLTEKEKSLIAQHSLNINQIAFRRKVHKDYKRLAAQEFPDDDESCFLTGGVCFFDVQELLEWIDNFGSAKNVEVEREHITGGKIQRWEEPQKGVRYVLGCDTSEGLPDCDLNGIGIMRKDTGKQVLSVHGRFRPPQLAEICCKYSTEYNRALIGIERQNYGHAVIQKVKELGIRKPQTLGGRLYYFKPANNPKASRAGWDTNAITRPKMLQDLEDYVEAGLAYGDDIIRDRDFISECTTFRLQSNGKFEADSGAYDDRVIKWAIANQMRNVKIVKPQFHVPGE